MDNDIYSETPDCPGTLLCCKILSTYLVVGRISCVLSSSDDHFWWPGLTLHLCISKLLQVPLAVGGINSHRVGRSWLNCASGISPCACVCCYSIFISCVLKAWILLLSTQQNSHCSVRIWCNSWAGALESLLLWHQLQIPFVKRTVSSRVLILLPLCGQNWAAASDIAVFHQDLCGATSYDPTCDSPPQHWRWRVNALT